MSVEHVARKMDVVLRSLSAEPDGFFPKEAAMAVASNSLPVGARTARGVGERWTPWILLAPTLIIMNLVGVYPLLHSLYVSFTGLRPTNPARHQGRVGLDNYVRALTDDQFWHSIAMIGLFMAASVTLSLILAVSMAVLFNRRLPGFTLMRSLIMIPMLITPVAVGLTWRIMMMHELGVLNYMLEFIGIEPSLWIGSRRTAMMSIVLVDVWQWTPFTFIIIFAGLKSLPQSPFESAAIGGAGPFMVF